MAGLSAEESVILIITLVIVVLASIKAIRVSNRLCTGVHCGDLPSHVGTQGDKQRLRINELEEAEADHERITTLQMAQNRRQEAELEKARELLRRGRVAAQFMANEKLDNDIKAYLGDKA